jgi:ABC-type Fe3+-siderophore transport system permease subunit
MPGNPHHRRWTVLASGLLCGLLALVVVFTNRAAFFSPIAVVVVAAIGAAAVLIQLRLRNREQASLVHPPVWLNLLGIVLAVGALFADRLGLNAHAAQLIAMGAIASFAISSVIILHAFRKNRAL